jgi:hypothetical protein
MKRLPLLAVALAMIAAGCDDSPTGPSADDQPMFVATLSAASEVPPVANAESTATGTATITLHLTRDASDNVTAATADFNATLTGLQPTTSINVAHIHEGAAGATGSIVVNTSLAAGQVTVTNGAASFQRTGISVTAEVAQRIVANPSDFYFNVHSTLNPGGVARGQLVRQ